MGKRGVNNTYILVLFSLMIISGLSVFASAQTTNRECTVNPVSTCDGQSIYTAGYGAVELCQVCYKCGAKDDICPELYSDGVFEDNTVKTNITMRVKRPTFESDNYSVNYQTGNLACESIGGNCDYVQRSTDNLVWINLVAECNRNVSVWSNDNNNYYRAICKEVPQKAGCEHCPDPDCVNSLSGYATENTVEAALLSDVNISISAPNNLNLLVKPDGRSINGIYRMEAVPGYLNITCSKPGYVTYSRVQYLSSGNNIFDCRMDRDEGACTPQCFSADAGGAAICDASCDGVNGCNMTALAKLQCSGRYYSDYIVLSTQIYESPSNGCNYSNITMMHCCAGAITSQVLKIVGPGGCNCEPDNASCFPIGFGDSGIISSNASDLITRDYRKVLDGSLPVTLKVIVYNKRPLTLKIKD